ncbi:MAG: hypothetical protein ACRDE7_03870 [Sphingobacterium sp.]
MGISFIPVLEAITTWGNQLAEQHGGFIANQPRKAP